MTAQKTKWEFPNHLAAARAVVVATLPKVLEGYDPLMFWRLEKEVTSKSSQTSKGNEVRLVTFEFWPLIGVYSITLRLEKESRGNPSPSGLAWTPISMEIGPRATLKRRFCFSGRQRGTISVQFKVVERVERRLLPFFCSLLNRDLVIAEIQVL